MYHGLATKSLFMSRKAGLAPERHSLVLTDEKENSDITETPEIET